MKKWTVLILLSMMFLVLAACSDNDEAEQDHADKDNGSEANAPVEISDEEKVDASKTVLTINGTEIKGKAYNAVYVQVKTLYGANITDTAQLKELTIELLTQQELINQDASKLGIKVTEEEAEEELKTYKEKNADQFQAVLDRFQLSEEAFKEQMTGDLLREKYIDDQFDVNVTDEEIKAFYDQQFEEQDGENIPKLEDVRNQIKEGLKSQKEQSKVQERVNVLKEDAEIEVLI
ncbi:SurA N-terminal domain-containing protein [Lentibacillus saliphilus]|uniref:SurA N-terminal domain-containing protein n=1 Tax=Lentibacillus saliphilus TaxID=2737028 RepID=UPI001C3096FD|nr:SurA N-terminal domain-containing protein [Lentibacillus saliphilus]